MHSVGRNRGSSVSRSPLWRYDDIHSVYRFNGVQETGEVITYGPIRAWQWLHKEMGGGSQLRALRARVRLHQRPVHRALRDRVEDAD
ncbi:hypothetical protein PLEOSDRAFT_154021 [Pleurotus ostreatus PC15]|uniref:Uncharacterized protein n=1 Tax=Pleurotus ostreatus (strain PC15) TaxID=1137138 RepID=A0A067NVA4_PLEO1|nr:hypothetical protein PLEOSDRAFT_154021 [Pleurotus ostreatus PC15]